MSCRSNRAIWTCSRDLPERFGPWQTVHGRFARWAADGTRNDCTQAAAVISRIRVPRPGPGRPRTRPERVVADKGYSARTFRTYLRRRGIKATIPERTDQLAGRMRRRERPCGFNKAVYRRRNVVERCFHRLKQWRGTATRYEKVRRLPVIDGHRLVGMVALADVARALPDPQVGDLLEALSTD
ncbi:transposase [Streptomyces caniferus]|uniref:transposase n=1 Tax=Streptomyces caniferus TaxID=285557 RepID=UPI003F4D5A45